MSVKWYFCLAKMSLLVTSSKDAATHKAVRKCYASWSGCDSLHSRSFLFVFWVFSTIAKVSVDRTYQRVHSEWLLHADPAAKARCSAHSFFSITSSVSETKSKAEVTLRELVSIPQVLNSKGHEHWKSYTTRVPKETMEFFPRKIENHGWLWVLEVDLQRQRNAEN